jgi:predicted ATPase/DNA-binding SARP family transcriptional activator
MSVLRLFGYPTWHEAGSLAEALTPDRATWLLVLLASRNDWLARDEVLTWFWPEAGERQARANLRQLLHRLRRRFPLEVSHEQMRLLAQSDLLEFERLVAEEQWEAAAALAAQDFLAGFPDSGLDGFDAWVRLRRERLRQLRIQAIGKAAALAQGRSHLDAAMQLLTHGLTEYPWSEELLAPALRLALGRDQLELAQNLYHRSLAVLQHLGAEPSHELQALAAQFGRVKRSPLAPGQQRELRQSGGQLLIGRVSECQRLRAWLANPADSANQALFTIVGPGGVGKSRLAQALWQEAQQAPAQQSSARPSSAQPSSQWLSLAGLNHLEEVMVGVAALYGHTLDHDPLASLLQIVQGRSGLLVLDNAEHLLAESLAEMREDESPANQQAQASPMLDNTMPDSPVPPDSPRQRTLSIVPEPPEPSDLAGLLQAITQVAPQLRLLVTSREVLGLAGEQVLALSGLSLGPNGEAVQLFGRLAERLLAHFLLSEHNRAQIARIVEKLAGMPLAIELASGWLRLLSLGEIEAELERGLDFLVQRRRDLPARQRSLRAVFEGTWQRLSPLECQVLRSLSLFRGGFDQAAAWAVAAASRPLLWGLVGKSLLQVVSSGEGAGLGAANDVQHSGRQQSDRQHSGRQHSGRQASGQQPSDPQASDAQPGWLPPPSSTRFLIHELLRQFMNEWPPNAQKTVGPATKAGLYASKAHVNLAETRETVQQRHLEYFLALAERADAYNYSPQQGRWHQALLAEYDNLRASLEFAKGHAPSLGLRLAAALHWFWYVCGFHGEGLAWLQGFLADETGAVAGAVAADQSAALLRFRVLQATASLAKDRSQYQLALACHHQALALAEATNTLAWFADPHHGWGQVLRELGDYLGAEQHFQQALRYFEANNDRFGASKVLNDLGILASYANTYDQAQAYFERCLAIKQEINDLQGISYVEC